MHKLKMFVYGLFYIHHCRIMGWHDEAKAHEQWLKGYITTDGGRPS